jgi:hypothetical protein
VCPVAFPRARHALAPVRFPAQHRSRALRASAGTLEVTADSFDAEVLKSVRVARMRGGNVARGAQARALTRPVRTTFAAHLTFAERACAC